MQIFCKHSDANMMSDPRDCSKCDRKMEKGELFYHSKEDDDYDLCIDCYDKKISKRKISEEDFQLMVYCLPSGSHKAILIIVSIIQKKKILVYLYYEFVFNLLLNVI